MTLGLPVEHPEGAQTLGLEFWGAVCARERSWGWNCMCVFSEAPDLFNNTQGEGTGELGGGEEGIPENTLIRVTQKLRPLGSRFSPPSPSRTCSGSCFRSQQTAYAISAVSHPKLWSLRTRCVYGESFSRRQLCDPLDYIAHQASLSMAFFRQEYWSGLSFPPPGDLPNPGFKSSSPVSPALAGGCTTESPGKPYLICSSFKSWGPPVSAFEEKGEIMWAFLNGKDAFLF